MGKTMKLSEAQFSFDQWNKVRSECAAGADFLKVLAVDKMTETATTFSNWNSTKIFSYELGMTEHVQKAFVMMQKTASCFSDWHEVARHCEADVAAFIKSNPDFDKSQEFDEYRQVFETAKAEMLKTHSGYSDWDMVLSESYYLIELCDFALKMAIETVESPTDCVELYCSDPDDKELNEMVLAKLSLANGPFSEWLEAYEGHTLRTDLDNKLRSILLQKMSETYTTLSEWEKLQQIMFDGRVYRYGDLLAKSLTNDQWLTFFGLTE